jgi:hypothetical protein
MQAPEAAAIHHINGVFATDIMGSQLKARDQSRCAGKARRLPPMSLGYPWLYPLFGGFFGLNDASSR